MFQNIINTSLSTKILLIVKNSSIMSGQHCFENTNTEKFSMNDDADLYRKSNSVMRQDAIDALNEYSSKFIWKETNENVMDIGCADGSVTDILRTYLPKNTNMLMGCDINEKAVEYAKERYGNNNMVFTTLNIEGDIPEDLKGKFNHLFSFYTLHWIRNQTKGFTNIYDLMSEDGECFFTFLGFTPMYSLYEALKDTPKWRAWLTDFDQFVSPYHHCSDTDRVVQKMLMKIGFRYIDVRSRQKKSVYNNISDFRNLAAAVNPFKIPEHRQKEFLNDLMDVGEDLRIINKKNNTVTMIYNLLYVHCRK